MTKVDIYWNLIKKCWSVRSREGDTYGKVVGHLDSCVIVKAKFVVNPKGRERVLRERRKNVHAFVRGDLLMSRMPGTIDSYEGWAEAKYNPYETNKFLGKDKIPLESAQLVLLSTDGKAYYFLGEEVHSSEYDDEPLYDEPFQSPNNYMDDGEALASAGMGTDEDYGYYGETL